MRVVIVGGTGNISGPIVDLLLEHGHDVTCLNRGVSDLLPRDVRLIKGDRHDREWYEKTMQHENFDIALDMICYTPDDAASNIKAFRGVKQYIHTSTVVTYGVEFEWMPVTEDHPLKPTIPYGKMKVAGDNLLLEAYYREGFPVTIIKPSTTIGPKRVLCQYGLGSAWIDRIRKGKPVLMLGDGKAIHPFLFVEDAAKGYVGAIGKDHCIGQVYNLVNPNFTNWEDYYRTAMKVLGKEVDLVGVPIETLVAIDKDKFAMAKGIFALNLIYSTAKINRDIPEFRVTVSLAGGLKKTVEYLDEKGLLENSDDHSWEDRVIAAQRLVSAITL
jgi:nucleoside-diphosphate-sugar epimerase